MQQITLTNVSPLHQQAIMVYMSQVRPNEGVRTCYLQGRTATFEVDQPNALGDSIARVLNSMEYVGPSPLKRLLWSLYKAADAAESSIWH